MDKIELYTYLCYGSFALSVLFLIAAVICFFLFDIRSVFGYLTGRSAKKEIKALEKESAVSGKLVRKSVVLKEYRKQGEHTQKSKEIRERDTLRVRKIDETTALNLNKQKQDVTDSLEMDTTEKEETPETPVTFVVEREVILIHTDEVI